jgi:hypothetical protein
VAGGPKPRPRLACFRAVIKFNALNVFVFKSKKMFSMCPATNLDFSTLSQGDQIGRFLAQWAIFRLLGDFSLIGRLFKLGKFLISEVSI